MKENKAREEVVKLFLDCLEKGDIPWYQGFIPSETSFNPITHTVYRNCNRFILYLNEYVHGYKDPRWMTFKQAKDQGYSIKKGAKGVHIEYWSLYDSKDKKILSQQEARDILQQDPERESDFRYVSRVYTVFNGTQIDGLKVYKSPRLMNQFDEDMYHMPLEVVHTFARNTNLLIKESEKVNTPYYHPGKDIVVVPAKERYIDENAFFSDVFHEISHATSHPARLNREILPLSVSKEDYAIEELRAEISSAFICNALGIQSQANRDYLENSVAYVQSWLHSIQDKPHTLFSTIKDAENISNYVILKSEYEKKLELQKLETDYLLNGNYEKECLSMDDFKSAIVNTDIYEVSNEEMKERIKQWENNHQSIPCDIFYTLEDNVIIGADNRTGDLFIEEFDFEDSLFALMWMEDKISISDYYQLNDQLKGMKMNV